MHDPVTYADKGLARNRITPAASSTVPGRDKGISDTSRNFLAATGMPVWIVLPPTTTVSSLVGGLVIRVSIHPNATALHLTPYLEVMSF